MSPQLNRIILFANGDLPDPQAVHSSLSPDDFLIAVDGGFAPSRRVEPHTKPYHRGFGLGGPG